MNNKGAKWYYFTGMFRFMKPFIFSYAFGLFAYSTQMFFSSLISSLFMNRLSGAMLNGDRSGVAMAALQVGAFMVAWLAMSGVGVYLFVKGMERAEMALKAALFRSFVRNSVESAGAAHSGEGIAAVNTDANTASGMYGNPFSAIVSCVLTIIMSAVVIFAADYRLGFVSVGVGLTAFFIQYRFAAPLGNIGKEKLSVNADAVKEASNILSGAASIRSFNLQNRAMIRFDRENSKLLTLSFKEAFIGTMQNMFTTVQGWLTLTGVYGVGGYLVATGRLDFPTLMMVPSMCIALASGMAGIGSAWGGLQAPLAAAKRVIDIIDRGKALEAASGHKIGNDAGWSGDYSLHLKDVNFTYMGQESQSLSNISLNIGKNQTVAFVGESGSGKSTLLRAVIGMYERGDIDIKLGNMDFRSVPATLWRGYFAYVDQSCKLFDMSIAENIELGKPGSSIEEIHDAAMQAGAYDFIMSLPDGFNTQCGEKGASLSGGQKQRIAIARALVRKAPILVFDEATSALDGESERLIMETIARLRYNHTILLTTHNMRYISDADMIVVMKHGCAVQTGTHAQLAAAGGEFGALLGY